MLLTATIVLWVGFFFFLAVECVGIKKVVNSLIGFALGLVIVGVIYQLLLPFID